MKSFKHSLLTVVGLVSLLAAGSGCYKTVYRTGNPPGMPAPGATGAWHVGVVSGLVEITQLPPVQSMCPSGFSEIKTQVDFVKGLVNAVVSGIIYFQDVTVVCSGSAAPAASAGSTFSYKMRLDQNGRAVSYQKL
jgi:hypothetical protein